MEPKEVATQTIIEGIFSRHSIRQFSGAAVKKEDLELIAKAGMAAPSAVNVQPWAFILVTDRKLLDGLCQSLPYAKMLAQAGAAVIVCGIPDKDDRFAKDYWMFDCAAASENVLLAAHALGYGAVWTAVYPEEQRIQAVRAVCHIPESVIPLNVIPIGVPLNKNTIPMDKYTPENVHWDSW